MVGINRPGLADALELIWVVEAVPLPLARQLSLGHPTGIAMVDRRLETAANVRSKPAQRLLDRAQRLRRDLRR